MSDRECGPPAASGSGEFGGLLWPEESNRGYGSSLGGDAVKSLLDARQGLIWRLDSSVNAFFDGLEDATTMSDAESIGHAGPATGSQLGPPSVELHDTDLPKTTSVSLRSENAIDTCQRCLICGEPTVYLGQYRLEGSVFRKINGNGPYEIPARDGFEPRGELGVRLGHGR